MKLVASGLIALLATVVPSAAREMSLPEAIEAQQELVDTNPNDATMVNDLGNLLLLIGRFPEAEDAYRRAVQLDSNLTSAHFNLGLLLHQTERPAKARREFKMVLKAEPDHPWAHYQLGVIDAQLGRRNSAIKSYARALRLDPRLTDPAYNPHIVDNHLAASAILKAYADLNSTDLVPRTYESPRRIAGMFIPMLPKALPAPRPDGAAFPTPRVLPEAESDAEAEGAAEPK